MKQTLIYGTLSDKQYYNSYENRYQAVYQSGIPLWGTKPNDEIVVRSLNDWVHENNLIGKRVIEFACGEGSCGVILSKLGCIYHGVDIAPSAVKKAKTALADYPNATVEVLNMVESCLVGEYDAAFDSMGLHMLVTDSDRAKYLSNVYACLKPGAPALFFRESYRKNLPSMTVDSFEQWLEITGDDYSKPSQRKVENNGTVYTVSVPHVPARGKNEAGYIAEMQQVGLVVDKFVPMDFSEEINYSASIYVHKEAAK